nr:hypothetical protein [uncultured Flavobacterium sp.]
MKITDDFFNKVAKEIRSTYFPQVKYYRENKHTEKIHYALELFSNGCSTYDKLINVLSLNTKDNKENIHTIVSKYVTDFEGYQYNHSK